MLPPSEIGEVAVFARCSGETWFMGIVNGPEARSVHVPLNFLERGDHSAMLVQDNLQDAAAVRIENLIVGPDVVLEIDLAAGGGFVGRFGQD